MMYSHDHERYVLKNRMLASAYSGERRGAVVDKKGDTGTARHREASCFSCKSKSKCPDFRAKRTGGTKGVVSFGGTTDGMICNRYEPMPERQRSMSDRQIKSLMKNFKRSM
jgi:hypothetical protein